MVTKQTTHSSSSSAYSSSGGTPSSPHSPTLAEDWDTDDEDAMSSHDYVPSRPLSVAHPAMSNTSTGLRRPNLREILSNTSPAPWTLAAFMAYLSNNHCLETLEFTMDAGRYRKHYEKMLSRAGANGVPNGKDREFVRALWQKLVDAYIQPSGSREVNLPSDVRDPILNLRISEWPPAPEKLDDAVLKIYELMEDSVLVPFLNSVYPQVSRSSAVTSPYDTSEDSPQITRSIGVNIRQNTISSPSRSLEGHGSSQAYSHHRQSAPSTLSTSFPRVLFNTKLSPTSASHSGGMSSLNDTPATTSDTALSHTGSGPSMTDDSGAGSPVYDALTTPPTSPPMSDSSPKRDSGMWKKASIGQKAKKSRGVSGGRSLN